MALAWVFQKQLKDVLTKDSGRKETEERSELGIAGHPGRVQTPAATQLQYHKKAGFLPNKTAIHIVQDANYIKSKYIPN